MHLPDTYKVAYIDFDSFFASVEEQENPDWHGKPIGVVPIEYDKPTSLIAVNKVAKRIGIKGLMSVREAKKRCPNLILVPQKPKVYERYHQRLLTLIESEVPIETICSIDEVACFLDTRDQQNPEALAARIKQRIRDDVGPYVTCSIGFAPNHQLAKIASEMDKPDGVTLLHPRKLPGRLLGLTLDDIPGIGRNMRTRLNLAGIGSVKDLWNTQPKQLRKIWGNVNGERFWYALHGYEVQSQSTKRSMFGHGRVLPPDWRDFDHGFECARFLTTKAAWRLRRAGFLARRYNLWLRLMDGRWAGECALEAVNDNQAAISALQTLWFQARQELPSNSEIKHLHIAFSSLVALKEANQFSMFSPDQQRQKRWGAACAALDDLNRKYSKTVVSMGPLTPPPGGYAGGKIAFSRVPDMEDFW
jgi:DNA polymerase-4